MCYGITCSPLIQLAYELAESNNLQTRFTRQKRSAGKEWYLNFMRHHPELSLRAPKPISRAASALVTNGPLFSSDSFIDEEPPLKQLSEIVTTSQLKDDSSTSGMSYIQVAEINL
ncbi:hypothetical protein ILUMI_12523 [Ignelater luminosus]|uniref:HTH CENPB-type domain-containing protein n=1 Tax=Ignelater luminosus TaxID=2038154 RepID=A0A8K0D2N3_IGNLU|nr:hypothetical protein ILUMI_12523 [Ignelater luminosus]